MDTPDHDLQFFKLTLLKLKAELLEASVTGQQAEAVVDLDQARVGRLSRMDAMQARAMSLETGRRRRQHLLQIDAALERIESGEYGECNECGDTIHPGRLQADPTATLCIICAQEQE